MNDNGRYGELNTKQTAEAGITAVESNEDATRSNFNDNALRMVVRTLTGDAKAKKGTAFSKGKGLKIKRFFTKEGVDPYDELVWELRDSAITGEKGETVFEQKNVEVPVSWSQFATNVVASKYFRGQIGSPDREYSVKQLINRVINTITEWGRMGDYFASEEDALIFREELKYMLVNQMAAFNSPVWFNLGWHGRRQAASACYINSVDDSMDSILDLYKIEGLLFKDGSGSGVNLSTLRSSKERLSAGGNSSGPVSFMRGLDASAGSIKSGGSTRRAACMRVLNVDHPDIIDFIECKAKAEQKAHDLVSIGYSSAFNVPNGAYDSVPYQNANHSVRVTDAFMSAVEKDAEWQTKAVTDGAPIETLRAREVMEKIAQSAWMCGDPGMQYHDTTNQWHTCINTAEIVASNPCSEFVFLNNTACNLASLNLMKFRKTNGVIDPEMLQVGVDIIITAQEILVSFADYPTDAIAKNSYDFRPLGLGYANLGALLMSRGLPYDSDEGRAYAAVISALMTGSAYRQSAKIARDCGGPFPRYQENREPALKVLRQHRDALNAIDAKLAPPDMMNAARNVWNSAVADAEQYGIRNAQATVLAPTGTIGFMMDCDTTGIEPDIALVKYKTLVGGGLMKIVNQTVPSALKQLDYPDEQINEIIAYIDETGTIENAPFLNDEHLPVFDCAFRPYNGRRSIAPMGHVKMMAAVQPFISGAISKTVNMPNETTPEDIADIYMQAWKLGLKAIAIYRDGCKNSQPLSTKKPDEEADNSAQKEAKQTLNIIETQKPVRHRLPNERASITHKFSVGGHEGYITVGLYEDGKPGEIFITMSKEGSVISGVMDAFATSISMALQYGVPLETLVDKFSHMRFEPSGPTSNPQIPMAKSIMDYIFRWLALKFLQPSLIPEETNEDDNDKQMPRDATKGQLLIEATVAEREKVVFNTQSDAPPCPDCGSILIRNGACYKCLNCGLSYGCS